ncbi:DUF2787 family protein [Escherichia coli]|nr:DUF2787 family protein [Escherichia coli]
MIGDISLAAERNELWSLWERNFMEYLSMGIYRVPGKGILRWMKANCRK